MLHPWVEKLKVRIEIAWTIAGEFLHQKYQVLTAALLLVLDFAAAP